MEKNNILNFEIVVAVIEKAMTLDYNINAASESDNYSFEEVYISKGEESIYFYTNKENDNNKIILVCKTSNFGHIEFEITNKDLIIFKLLIEKVKEYNEVRVAKVINNFFPKVEEKKSVTTIDDLDDEND